MKKRLLSLVLAFALCMGLTAPALAYGDAGIAGQTTTLDCGYNCIAVIDSNNTLWMWGSGNKGLLGDREAAEDYFSTIFYETPKKIMENAHSISISASESYPFGAVIKTDGSLWTWGWNNYGQLGDGGKGQPIGGFNGELVQLTPQKIMDNVTAISCGETHTAAIKSDGSLWMWGSNKYGQVGNGHADENQTTPVKVMDNVSVVSCGSNYTAAVKTDGTLWMWGDTSGNHFNNGSISNHTYTYFQSSYSCQTVPVKVMDNVVSVSCGIGIPNPFVIQADGTLVTWAEYTEMGPRYEYGMQVGESPIPPKEPLPLQIIAQDVVAVTDGPCYPLGRNNVAYIKKDSSLWVYGDNRYCLLGVPEKINTAYTTYEDPANVLNGVAAVAVCGCHSIVAVKNDGSIWAWGLASSIGNNIAGDYSRNMRDLSGNSFSVQCQSVPLRITNITAKLPVGQSALAIPAVGGFTDVKETDYFADAVLWAVEKDITSGTGATTFSPNAACTNAQILTLLWRANGSPEPTTPNPFSDIKPADYYYKAALWAAEKGLVSGSAFGANIDCTRAMTVEYLWKAAGSPAPAGRASFTDVPTNADYAQAVAWAVEQNITSGTSATAFSPDATCTRGQIVTFLYRAMK